MLTDVERQRSETVTHLDVLLAETVDRVVDRVFRRVLLLGAALFAGIVIIMIIARMLFGRFTPA
jgi:hypothetical protein